MKEALYAFSPCITLHERLDEMFLIKGTLTAASFKVFPFSKV
jgi:hypothetical protein